MSPIKIVDLLWTKELLMPFNTGSDQVFGFEGTCQDLNIPLTNTLYGLFVRQFYPTFYLMCQATLHDKRQNTAELSRYADKQHMLCPEKTSSS